MTTRQVLVEKLRADQGYMWTVLDHIPNPIFCKDLDSRYVACNKAFVNAVELASPDDVVGKSDLELIGDAHIAARYRKGDREVIETGMSIVNQVDTYDGGDGATGIVITRKAAIRDADGTVIGVLGVCVDVTKEQQAIQRLADSEARLTSIISNIAHGVQDNDCSGVITFSNPAHHRIMGYDNNELVGKKIWDFLLNDEEKARARAYFFSLIAHQPEPEPHIAIHLRKDGTQIWLRSDWAYRRNAEGELIGLTSLISDITESKRKDEALRHMALHDPLTQLPNRMMLNQKIEAAIARAQAQDGSFAVLFLDLDRFKNVNDSLGHSSGDSLLKKISVQLTRSLRPESTVARVGGDEFVVLLEDSTDVEGVMSVAETILRVTALPVQVGHHQISMELSMGISIYPQDGETAERLLQNADSAMYRAKDRGGNNYQFYTKELTQNALSRVLLENGLRLALLRNELLLYYQPQVNLETREVISLEALIRWRHPDVGLVSPSAFIPVACESGLIVPIGRWVLNEACRQAQSWRSKGFRVGRVAVNVAGIQLQRGSIVEDVIVALKSSGLPARCLELEITENFIMQRADAAIALLEQLREIGVQLSIDDFGTGYSCLSYLKKLPINKLKIDQSFVRDISHDANDKAISDAIIAMGKSLGIDTIAEGVETGEQARLLIDAGCIEAQGYLFGKPSPPKEVEALLSRDEVSEVG